MSIMMMMSPIIDKKSVAKSNVKGRPENSSNAESNARNLERRS